MKIRNTPYIKEFYNNREIKEFVDILDIQLHQKQIVYLINQMNNDITPHDLNKVIIKHHLDNFSKNSLLKFFIEPRLNDEQFNLILCLIEKNYSNLYYSHVDTNTRSTIIDISNTSARSHRNKE